MDEGHWYIVLEMAEPFKIDADWMDSNQRQLFKIQGKVGDEYLLDESDPESRRRIVGEIQGRAAELLNSIDKMINIIDESDMARQGLRYEIFSELVQDVVQAVRLSSSFTKKE